MQCSSNSIASGRQGEYYNNDINFRSGETFLQDRLPVFFNYFCYFSVNIWISLKFYQARCILNTHTIP